MNLIYDFLYIRKDYGYAKDLEEDKCEYFMLNMNGLEEKTDMDLLIESNDKSDIIDLDDVDPKCKNVLSLRFHY